MSYFYKIGSARRAMWLQKNGGVLDVLIRKNSPKTGLFWQKMQGAFYLYPLVPPELIAAIQNIQTTAD